MKISKAKQQIIEDAQASGFQIEQSDHGVNIFKVAGRWNKVSKGIRICENGTAIRLDIDLSVSAGIRSISDMRKVLGI